MAEYISAKQRLFATQKPTDIAIYYSQNENSQQIAMASPGTHIPYMAYSGAEVIKDKIVIDGQTVCAIDDLKLLGRHNWQNACAALTTFWQVVQDIEPARKVLTSFTGLPFRIEFRKKINDVRFYNDSYASAPGAEIAALKSIDGKKVMIVGGFDRGLDLSQLATEMVNNQSEIRKVLLIGASAERTAEALKQVNFSNFEQCKVRSMSEIVSTAYNLAQPGDAVVLSPGFASFDMFKNFEDRGIQFNDAVEKL